MAVLTQLKRRGHARQTAPDASRLRAKTRRRQTHRRGSPTLDTEEAGWETQEPRVRVGTAGHLVPARGSYQEHATGPRGLP